MSVYLDVVEKAGNAFKINKGVVNGNKEKREDEESSAENLCRAEKA